MLQGVEIVTVLSQVTENVLQLRIKVCYPPTAILMLRASFVKATYASCFMLY